MKSGGVMTVAKIRMTIKTILLFFFSHSTFSTPRYISMTSISGTSNTTPTASVRNITML